MSRLNYFVIGSGIFGCVIAERIASVLNEEVLVIEKRDHIGGNCHSIIDCDTGIECHQYGSHIFHTKDHKAFEYISRFCELTSYRHKVLVHHDGEVYFMPINLFTINKFYRKNFTPSEAADFLAAEISRDHIQHPVNLEEQAISLIGKPLYQAFIKNYTTKQWGRKPCDLPAAIINRLPFRVNYDTGYFTDPWQGVPKDGYYNFFKKIIDHPNITVKLNCDYHAIKNEIPDDAMIIYTGLPDPLFDYKYGPLDWRSLRFEWQTLPLHDFQGTTVMNYADLDLGYTRIHEFKHYHPERIKPYNLDKTVICREYPATYEKGGEAYYPVNDARNNELYGRYAAEAEKNRNLILGGRLGLYRYMNMDETISAALRTFDDKIYPYARK